MPINIFGEKFFSRLTFGQAATAAMAAGRRHTVETFVDEGQSLIAVGIINLWSYHKGETG